MGARDYVTQRSDQINQGKTDVLSVIEEIHKTQITVLTLRQKAQIEQLREPDSALANAMEMNVTQLAKLEAAFNAVVGAVEKLPSTFLEVDFAEKRLEAALPPLPSSSGGPPSSS